MLHSTIHAIIHIDINLYFLTVLYVLFREVRQNVILHQDEYEITYLQNYSYVFDAETSCSTCSEHDVIIIPNIAVLVSGV